MIWTYKASKIVATHTVKTEAARRQVALDADPEFAGWLEWAEEHVREVDPLGPGRPLPIY